MDRLKVFSCSESAEKFTDEVCDYLKIEKGKINKMKFKNDNNFVQILESVRDKDVFLIQTTQPPVNERIMELLITIDAIKRASAKKHQCSTTIFSIFKIRQKGSTTNTNNSKTNGTVVRSSRSYKSYYV